MTDSSLFIDNRTWTPPSLMSYSRNRVIIKQSVNFQINSNGLQSFTSDGKINWTYNYSTDLSFRPVLASAGRYLSATLNNSKFALFESSNGKKIREYSIPGIIFSEPVIANGWIYCGTKNGKLVAINTKNKSITDWGQWGMTASQNAVIK